jgi:hypothetical protein
VSLTPEHKHSFIAELEKMGVPEVKHRLDRGTISGPLVPIAFAWLAEKEREDERRRDAFNSEQIEIAKAASLTAERAAAAAEAAAKEAARASAAAERQAAASERQATAAERANRRATIALMIAITSIITTMVSIWITHNDAGRPTESGIKQEPS